MEKRKLLILLCIACSTMISSNVSAKNDVSSNEMFSKNEIDKSQSDMKPYVVKEIIAERGPNYKKYLMNDGSFTMQIYLTDVHFENGEGEYQDINTDLVDELDISDSISLISKDAAKMKNKIKSIKKNNQASSLTSFHVPFYSEVPQKISDGYSIEKEGEKLSFIPIGASDNSKAFRDEANKSLVKYYDVWKNTDVELQIINNGLKENIILKDENSPKKFSFEVKGTLNDDFSGERLHIEQPWIIDANGVTRNVKMIKRTIGTKKIIDYTWDDEGLKYPVIIDPIVSLNPLNVGCVNQYYSSGFCTVSSMNIAYKNVSVNSTDKIRGETFRTYLRYVIPKISDLEYLIKSDLSMDLSPSDFQGSNSPTYNVKPYALAEEWPLTFGTTWGAKPAIYEMESLSQVHSFSLFNTAEKSRRIHFDVTNIYNFYLKKPSNSLSIALVSLGHSYQNKEFILGLSNPKLEIQYKAFPDLEPPTTPKALNVTGLTNNSVSLSWDKSIDNSNFMYYQILSNGSVVSSYYTNSFTVSGLTANTKYIFTVRAIDGSNNLSKESNPVTVTPGAIKPFANFLNLSEGDIYSNPIVFNWSYFDPGGKSMTNFEIKGSDDNWATTSFNTGVKSAATYYYTYLPLSKPWSFAIRVDNGFGMGDWSYINNVRLNSGSMKYYYDSLGRLSYLTINEKIRINYSYDRNGNILRSSEVLIP